MITTYHLAVSIEGLKKRLTGEISTRHGSWKIFSHSDGSPFTKKETWAAIEEHEKLGHECIVGSNCDHVGPKGQCLGHEKLEEKTT